MTINRWFNVELKQDEAENFRQFLYDNTIKHEVSGCFNLVHFEMLIQDDYEYTLVDTYLRQLTMNNLVNN